LYANYNDFGNPSLPVTVRVNQDPIRSTSYDLGVQWAFIEGFGLDINAYYRDIENYGVYGWNIIPRAPWRLYILSTNFGYADSRGVELTLRKNVEAVSDFLTVGGRVTYAYSYIKQAVSAGGNPGSFSSVAGDSAKYAGDLPFDDVKNYNTIEQNVRGGNSSLTGGYDRPHRITYTLVLRFPYEVTVSSIGRFESGFYYPLTLGDPRARELGVGPWTNQIDLRLEKMFDLGMARVAVFLDIVNLFDKKNVIAYDNSPTGQLIWERTGDPTGYDAAAVPNPAHTGRPITQDGSPIYDVPREVYFGINVNF
jgi:outer membrane receptor protein involved in Fe transport